jgi:hypothetical protein
MIAVSVGDHSPSNSELWLMNLGPIRHKAAGVGVVTPGVYSLPRGSYDVSVEWLDGDGDYDYTATVEIVDECGIVSDPDELLGEFYDDNQNHMNLAEGKIAHLSLYASDTFRPDPKTHIDDEEVTILPGDTEDVLVDINDPDGVIRVVDPSIAMIRDGEELVTEISAQSAGDSITLQGLSNGSTELRYERQGVPAADCMSIPVKVGGTIGLRFSRLPTFEPYIGGGAPESPPQAAGQGESSPDDWIELGGAPFGQPGGREGIRDDLLEWIANHPGPNVIEMWVQIKDANGDPKKQKALFVGHRGPQGQLNWVRWETVGIFEEVEPGVYRCSLDYTNLLHENEIPGLNQSFTQKGFLIAVGETAKKFFEDELPHTVLEQKLLESNWGNYEFEIDDDGLLISTHFVTSAGEYFAGIVVNLPVVNGFNNRLLRHHLAAALWDDGLDLTGSIDVQEPDGTITTVEFGPMQRPLEDPAAAQSVSDAFFQMLMQGGSVWRDGRSGNWVIPSIWTITDSLVFEIIVSAIPGGDAIDIVKELVEFAVNGDPINKPLMAVCAVGLAFDAGYLAGPVGLAGNIAVAIVKRVIKSMPEPLVDALLRLGPNAFESMRVFIHYVVKMVDDGVNPLEVAGKLDRRMKRIAIESPLQIGEEALVDSIGVFAERSLKDVGDEAAEGYAAFVKHGDDGADGLESLLVKLEAHGDELGAESAEGIGEAVEKTYKRNAGAGGVPDPNDLRRVNEGMLIARGPHSGYDGVLNAFIGDGHAIKSLEEWNALKTIPADALSAEKKLAIKQIVDSIWSISEGTPVTKIVPLNGQFGGVNMIQNGVPTLAGFFARSSDVFDATTTPQLINRLRLDGPPFNFQSGSPYGRIRTVANPEIVGKSRLPRHEGFGSGHPKEEILPDAPYPAGYEYPFSGKGVPASLDGHTMPEMKIAEQQAATMSPDVTVMEFRFPDDTPYPQTITVDGVPTIASDWMLIPNAASPTGFSWAPIP